jgi:hypothetical protein
MLELDEGKLSRPVLRRGVRGNSDSLADSGARRRPRGPGRRHRGRWGGTAPCGSHALRRAARPRVSITIVPVTCRLDADLQADVEASAAAYEAQYGDAIPRAMLITTLWCGTLSNGIRPVCASAGRRTPRRGRRRHQRAWRHGRTHGTAAMGRTASPRIALTEYEGSRNRGRTDEITAQTTTPRMRTFLAECIAHGALSTSQRHRLPRSSG